MKACLSPLTITLTPSSSPISPWADESTYDVLFRYYLSNEEVQGKACVSKILPSHESFSLAAIFQQSARYQFAQFSTRFRNPAGLRPAGGMERFMVHCFVENLLPGITGFPDLDGPTWDKPSIKERLATLWATFTEQQRQLIHAKLRESGTLGITPGTRAVIGYHS